LPRPSLRIEDFAMTDWNEQLAAMREEYDSAPLRRGDLAPSPLEQFSNWLQDASDAGIADSNACSLATVDELSRPVSRAVLLKGLEDGLFIFYTNFESRKAEHLLSNPRACMHFPWFSLQRQVLVAGLVERVDDVRAEEYFKSRPYFSRLGAWASRQSAPLDSRETLEQAFLEAREKHGEDPPKPPHWGGFALSPESVEFWQGGSHRLHDRFLYERSDPDGWDLRRLYP